MEISQFIDSQQLIFIGQLVLSIILGAILGIERERSGKWAGPRTFALVCAGSTIFTALSLNFFSSNNALVASAIVTGIGFLGAGTIIHRADHVEGLTTAAGLWISASIGMAVATHQYFLSIVATMVILGVLMINDRPLKKMGNKK